MGFYSCLVRGSSVVVVVVAVVVVAEEAEAAECGDAAAGLETASRPTTSRVVAGRKPLVRSVQEVPVPSSSQEASKQEVLTSLLTKHLYLTVQSMLRPLRIQRL